MEQVPHIVLMAVAGDGLALRSGFCTSEPQASVWRYALHGNAAADG
jgi:hypothetical protein